jgi:hypothetical protein
VTDLTLICLTGAVNRAPQQQREPEDEGPKPWDGTLKSDGLKPWELEDREYIMPSQLEARQQHQRASRQQTRQTVVVLVLVVFLALNSLFQMTHILLKLVERIFSCLFLFLHWKINVILIINIYNYLKK